jgi:hypothetical protein
MRCTLLGVPKLFGELLERTLNFRSEPLSQQVFNIAGLRTTNDLDEVAAKGLTRYGERVWRELGELAAPLDGGWHNLVHHDDPIHQPHLERFLWSQ